MMHWKLHCTCLLCVLKDSVAMTFALHIIVAYSQSALKRLQSARGPACRFTQEELLAIDLEGRCVITDHEAFILFNLYGPAITSEENAADRFAYKMRLYEVRGSLTSTVSFDLLNHIDSFCCNVHAAVACSAQDSTPDSADRLACHGVKLRMHDTSQATALTSHFRVPGLIADHTAAGTQKKACVC